MNISRIFKLFVKIELSYAFKINLFITSEKLHGKVNYLIKTCVFLSFVGNYLHPSCNFRQFICCCFDSGNFYLSLH